jgi:hypothetical protein
MDISKITKRISGSKVRCELTSGMLDENTRSSEGTDTLEDKSSHDGSVENFSLDNLSHSFSGTADQHSDQYCDEFVSPRSPTGSSRSISSSVRSESSR